MKKFLSVFVLVALMITMIPTFFASAAPVPAEGETAAVVAQNDEGNVGLGEALSGLGELWGGLLKLVTGEGGLAEFAKAFVQVLGDFFRTFGKLWGDIVG